MKRPRFEAGFAARTSLLPLAVVATVLGCSEKGSTPGGGDAASDAVADAAGDSFSDADIEYDCPGVGDVPVFVTPDPSFPDRGTEFTLEHSGIVTLVQYTPDTMTVSMELQSTGDPPLPIELGISRVGDAVMDIAPGDDVTVLWQQGRSIPFGFFHRLTLSRGSDPVLYLSFCENCSGVTLGPAFAVSIASYGQRCEPSVNDCTVIDTKGISATCVATGETLEVFSGHVGAIACGDDYTVAVQYAWAVIDVLEGCENDSWNGESFMIQRDSACVAGMRLGFLAGCSRTGGTCIEDSEAWCSAENTFEFCGCDGVGFTSRCRFPDRPYAYPGDCVEGVTDATPPCGDDGSCEASQLCAFGPGCAEPERYCAVNTCGDAIGIEYCGCTGATFTSGCLQSDRPYAHGGACDDSSTASDAPSDVHGHDASSDIPVVP